MNSAVVAEFLRRLGHTVALIGRKPLGQEPVSTVLWPIDVDDPVDAACYLSRFYHSVYVNLNPLASYLRDHRPISARSINDRMVERRTRLLIDVDGHDMPKDVAREQAEAIKAEYGQPLVHSDSGNGFGLIYDINLPNDSRSSFQVKTYLRELKARYPCVDVSCFNAGRLTRVIGTFNRSKLTGERIETHLL
jgi:hypothetical protein